MPDFANSPSPNSPMTALRKVEELREIIAVLTGSATGETAELTLASRAAFFFQKKKESVDGLKRIHDDLRRRLRESNGEPAQGAPPEDDTFEFAELVCASKETTRSFNPQEGPYRELTSALHRICGENHPLTLWKTEAEFFYNLRVAAKLLAFESEALVRESKYLSDMIERKEGE